MNIIIKDFYGSEQSSDFIQNNTLVVLEQIRNDVDLDKIYICVNSDVSHYTCDNVIITDEKLNYANFHNFCLDIISDKKLDSQDIHLVSGSLLLNPNQIEGYGEKNYIGTFINQLKNLMNLLDRKFWFSTASDHSNYAFGKYYTALDILNINEQKIKEFPECFMFARNSNLDWIYIKANQNINNFRFNSDYDYDFLSIKECIMKSTVNDGYFSNFFITIPHEVGAFSRVYEFDIDNLIPKLNQERHHYNLDKYNNNIKNLEQREINIPDVLDYIKRILTQE